MKILIVDDEKMVLEETKEVVERVKPNAEILCADNYMQALQIVEEGIDVAFLDIEMPGMNGFELSKRTKELNPDINIAFVTAYADYALKECHAEDVLLCRRNQFAIDPDKVECDYYKFLKKDVSAINSYRGEYMKQYSWAEFSLRHTE